MPDTHPSRRERREHGREKTRGGKRRRPLVKSARLWIPVGIGVVLLVLVGLGLVALILVPKALTAKNELEAAIPLAHQVETSMLATDSKSAQVAAKSMQEHTQKAAAATDGRLWRSVEWIPVVGPNLHAVRVAADSANRLVADAVVPASALSLDSFKPHDGRIDVKAISNVTSTVDRAAEAVSVAQTELGTINQSALIGPVKSGVDKLTTAVDAMAPQLKGVQTAVKVLPQALGENGPKHYLMLFENNAETRGWAGNPAALLLVTVNDGAISIDDQASSSDFQNGLKNPVIPLDPSMQALYGSKIGEFVQDTTTPADFPYTAQLASAFWKQRSSTPIDGVMSFDPVALSYLLKATGPIHLPTGDVVTSDNAVPLFLNQVYYRYSDPKAQDAFFAAAAASVFTTVQGGNFSAKSLLDSLSQSVNEHRLLFWSADPAVEKLIANTPIAGTLPASNATDTGVGVFFNDTTAGKMEYYLYPSISVTSDQCTASTPTLTSSVVLQSQAPADASKSLPPYIVGIFYNGRTAVDVTLYGTVGGTMSDFKVDGQPAAPSYTGENLGRPVAKIPVLISPGQKLTVTYTMTGKAGDYGPLKVFTTGMPHPTPITLTTPGCAAGK
jgi:hypothetical protein